MEVTYRKKLLFLLQKEGKSEAGKVCGIKGEKIVQRSL